jgi:hypothetical protein
MIYHKTVTLNHPIVKKQIAVSGRCILLLRREARCIEENGLTIVILPALIKTFKNHWFLNHIISSN